MMKANPLLLSVTGGILLLASALSAPAALEVTAALDRSAISTDDAAVLTITISGDQQAHIELPEVDGLDFQPRGSSSNMSVINGRVSMSLSQTVLVQALQPGEYMIPRIRVIAGGDEALSEKPLPLQVVKGSGRSAQSRTQGTAPAPNMSGGQAAVATATAGKPGDLAFLEVIPSKTEAVVGELVPIEVRAFFRAGERVSLRSLPGVSGGAFTLKSQDGDARQERVTRDGVSYTMLTFYAGLAAVKPGVFPAEVTLDATVVVREKDGRNSMRGMRSRMGSLFNDPLFGDDIFDDFFGRLVEKEVELTADPIAITVTEIPADGKPSGFTGAVGKFTASVSATPVSPMHTGDPVTLKVQVEGEGNFDRVQTPTLSNTEGWRLYPAKSEFVSADAIGHTGVKVFEQVIAPQTPEVREIPSIELSYYNPETEAFEIARTEPIPLEVSGEAVPPQAVTAADRLAEATGEQVADSGGESAGVAGVQELTVPTPLYARGWFVATQVALILVALSGSMILMFRNTRRNPQRVLEKALQREMARVSAEMDRAIGNDDAKAFFESMRRALQTHAGRMAGVAPAAMTPADVRDAEIRQLLSAADAVTFSGQSMPADALRTWKARAMQAIAKDGSKRWKDNASEGQKPEESEIKGVDGFSAA